MTPAIDGKNLLFSTTIPTIESDDNGAFRTHRAIVEASIQAPIWKSESGMTCRVLIMKKVRIYSSFTMVHRSVL